MPFPAETFMTRKTPLRFFAGVFVGLVGAILLGEAVVRLRLPDEMQPFLGDDSSLTGVYRADPVLGADYRSLDDFRKQYAARLKELEEPDQPRRVWAWFGNSFVQAPDMLGDLAQSAVPEVGMFYLRRNAQLPLHVAQIRLLLDAGLKPERIIFVLLPIDTAALGKQPLRSMVVNRRGAITYQLRLPVPPVGALIRLSRLGMLAWVRSGKHVGNPAFQPRRLTDFVAPELQDDLAAIFHVLSATARQHDVPVTILLLPNREQVFGTAGYAVQDFVRERCRLEGMDCFDARDLFVDEPDKLSLFLPDWHFTTKANRIVLTALLAHWKSEPETTSAP